MEAAVALFEEEEYAQCLLLLSALRDTAPSVEVNHLLLVCRIHSSAAAEDWNQVLQVDEGASEADIKRQFRKLASKVHPDKCQGPGAEEAFKLLGKAAAKLSGNTRHSDSRKRQEDVGAAWWNEWDNEVEQQASKRTKYTSEPSHEDAGDEVIQQMTLEELRTEVGRRQKAVLNPSTDDDKSLTVVERQRRLRAARSLLSERLQAPSMDSSGFHTEQDGVAHGGFLP